MGMLRAVAVSVSIGLLTAGTVACSVTGTPTAVSTTDRTVSSAAEAAPGTTRSTPRPTRTPQGPPIGTATMQVRGGTGPVTITYQINGEAEQTETNVTLPWEKKYPVYDEVPSSVTADGGSAELICAIIMDGKLVSFETEHRPTCSFAYYG
ncbi:hypothetical protein L2K20_22965 [Mycobacterium sp. MBM]|nr:hypothetical protein [Mycobacterium sp. MBM]